MGVSGVVSDLILLTREEMLLLIDRANKEFRKNAVENNEESKPAEDVDESKGNEKTNNEKQESKPADNEIYYYYTDEEERENVPKQNEIGYDYDEIYSSSSEDEEYVGPEKQTKPKGRAKSKQNTRRK